MNNSDLMYEVMYLIIREKKKIQKVKLPDNF
jgi:hypothetical protein